MIRMLLAAVLVTAGAAHAQTQRGFYVALEAGLLRSSADKDAQDAALAAGGATNISSEMKQGATPIGIALGYNLNRAFGVEASFSPGIGFNNYFASYNQGANRGTTEADWHSEAALGAAAIGRLPIYGPLSLVGKAGVRHFKGTFHSTTRITTPGGALLSQTEQKGSGTATVPELGIGVSFVTIPEITVRTMYERIGTKAGMFGEGNDINSIRMFSIALVYQI